MRYCVVFFLWCVATTLSGYAVKGPHSQKASLESSFHRLGREYPDPRHYSPYMKQPVSPKDLFSDLENFLETRIKDNHPLAKLLEASLKAHPHLMLDYAYVMWGTFDDRVHTPPFDARRQVISLDVSAYLLYQRILVNLKQDPDPDLMHMITSCNDIVTQCCGEILHTLMMELGNALNPKLLNLHPWDHTTPESFMASTQHAIDQTTDRIAPSLEAGKDLGWPIDLMFIDLRFKSQEAHHQREYTTYHNSWWPYLRYPFLFLW